MKKILSALAILIGISAVLIFNFKSAKTAQNKDNLKAIISDTKAEVIADATCGCCRLFAEYLEQEGFDVELKLQPPQGTTQYKTANAIPKNLWSCHTTRIAGKFMEGHIPMEAIKKIFTEKPDLRGIALPGMPSASPGMPGPKLEPFEIHAITNNGQDGGVYLNI